MIEDIAKRIVDFQVRQPWYFVIFFLAVTMMLVPGLFMLVENVEPSLEKVLPQDVEEVRLMNDMRARFGADMMYLLVKVDTPAMDVREPAVLDHIDAISEKIRSRESVVEVNNLADIVLSQGPIPQSIVEVKEMLNGLDDEFVNDDYSLTVIRIRTDTGSSAQNIKETVDAIKEDIDSTEIINPGVSIQLTGFNAIDKATFEVIMSDFATITILSLALVSIVVLFTFKSIVKGMLPMVVVMVALLWTMGIVGYMGMTITVVSMVSAAMILGLGIDFGIHVVHNYFELRKDHNPRKSLEETMGELLRAMLGASMTTIAGFLALLFGVLPAMKNLGIILALGIFTTLIGAVFLLPVVVYLYDRR